MFRFIHYYCFCLFLTQVLSIRVENLHYVDKDATSITIKWTTSGASGGSSGSGSAVVDDNSGWIGYKIKYSRVVDDEQQQITNSNLNNNDKPTISLIYLNNLIENQYRIEKLQPFTNYKIQVSAYKLLNNEEGPSSNLIIVKTNETGNLNRKKKLERHKR